MLSILINSYAICPGMGSEPGMAWNWCTRAARQCELHIITEEEFRPQIEKALETLPEAANMHFYWNPVEQSVRDMCWRRGDWRFYYYYRKWQKKTLEIARGIMSETRIDLIHQLNMVGFREPGFLWKIDSVPFVWGPIGGMDNIPLNYMSDMGPGFLTKAALKLVLNVFQSRFSPRVRKAMKRSDVLMGATEECRRIARRYHGKEAVPVSETGCMPSAQVDRVHTGDHFEIVWAGMFVSWKKLDLALKTMALLKDRPCGSRIRFNILGEGTPDQDEMFRKLAAKLGVEDMCVWHGKIPHECVQQVMASSDLFFFTSVMETTSTVVMEAISNSLPVVCFDICGMSSVVDERVGRKIGLSNPKRSAREFADMIEQLCENPAELDRMRNNCPARAVELSWDSKIDAAVERYRQAVLKYGKEV